MTMPSVPAPDEVRCSIDVKLKSNWTYDESQGLFRGPRGKTLSVAESLPQGVNISHKVPHFLGRPQELLTKAERDLCRYLQVQFAEQLDPDKLITEISQLAGVESVTLAPRCELPASMPLASMAPLAMPSPPGRR